MIISLNSIKHKNIRSLTFQADFLTIVCLSTDIEERYQTLRHLDPWVTPKLSPMADDAITRGGIGSLVSLVYICGFELDGFTKLGPSFDMVPKFMNTSSFIFNDSFLINGLF